MRIARGVLVAALVAAGAFLSDAARAQQAPWRLRHEHPPVTYTMNVELVETGSGVRLVGKETVLWENATRDAVKDLRFHLYANAFRDKRSTFFTEFLRGGGETPEDMKFGEVQITSMSVLGAPLTPKFVAPDDGNADDRTVASVELPQAVGFGETVPVQVEFTVEMPRIVRRMGAYADFVMAAQWFPKIGRYVGRDSTRRGVKDGWLCAQYHADCEFCADFADYDVTLTFPSEYVVGASGAPMGADVAEDRAGSKTTRRRYRAESVVDFAWTAGKRLVERRETILPVKTAVLDDPVTGEIRRVRALAGADDDGLALPAVDVVVLVQPEHADQVPRYFEAARVALGMFGAWLGPYPWPRLTIVDTPWNSTLSGGMEYPSLVTVNTVDDSPPETHAPEGVTVHEICHQWLMGMLANDESQEAWLDEGINTYLTAHAMHLAYDLRGGDFHPPQRMTRILGAHFSGVPFFDYAGISAGWPEAMELPNWLRPPKVDAFKIWRDLPWLTYCEARSYAQDQDPMLASRAAWMRSAGLDAMVKPGWTYADRNSYRANAYARPALFLDTLRKTLVQSLGADEGERRFLRAIREYARDWRFRHPTTEDFLRKFQETTSFDPTPLADQLVRVASVLDYSVEVRPGAKAEPLDAKKPADSAATAPAKTTVVRVRRRGDAVVPIDLEVRHEDKKIERVRWETKDQTREQSWRDFTFAGVVVEARLDPAGVYLQDSTLCDQSFAVKPNARPAVGWAARFLGWLENALVSYGRFF